MVLSGWLYFRRTLSRVDDQSKRSLLDISDSSEAIETLTDAVFSSCCVHLGFDLLANQAIIVKNKSQTTTMRTKEPEDLRA